MNKLFCAVAAIAAAAASLAAGVQPAMAGEVHKASVRYADLDLASPAGLATFRGRVEAAAERVCGNASPAAIVDAQAAKACRAAFDESAASRIRPFLRTGTAEVLGTH